MKYKGLVTFPSEREFVTYPWAYWDNWFTDAEVNQICAYCAAGELKEGKTFAGYREDIRQHQDPVQHLDGRERLDLRQADRRDPHHQQPVVRLRPQRLRRLPIRRVSRRRRRPLRVAHRHALSVPSTSQVDDYGLQQPRKLSITIALNEPGVDFEGGEFQLNMGHQDLISSAAPQGTGHRLPVVPACIG
jgi:hypothetical protein